MLASVVDYAVKLYTAACWRRQRTPTSALELIGEDGTRTGRGSCRLGQRSLSGAPWTSFCCALPIGPANALRIWHDNTGLGASWYLECAEVTDASTGTAYHFDARCWLSAAEGLERTLPASLQGSQSEGQTDYQMVFFTGSVRQAGTDANVCVELRGTSGSTGALRIPAGLEAFERGSKDTFRLRAARVGAFQSLTVWHDNYGSEPAWFLERAAPGSDTPVYFPCQAWLSQERSSLKVTLEAGHEPRSEQRTEYMVSIFTGSQRGADTTGDVEVELDGKGAHPDWYLDKIEVIDTQHSDRYVFYANSWLNAAHGLEALLKSSRDEEPDLVEYTVAVQTGSMRGAGTDANVHVHLYGDAKSSGAHALDIPGLDPFERGQVRRPTCAALAPLSSIRASTPWKELTS
eukprot:jgi/Tetstr1/442609/TSEL_030705.t1